MTYFKIVDKETLEESYISSNTAQTLKQVNKLLNLDPESFELTEITYSEFMGEVEKIFEEPEVPEHEVR
jgi:hypothetical protein